MPTPATNLPAAVAFPPTHWSVILTAGHGGSADAAAALAELCRVYWYPLYAFARRQGFLPEDAEDLTQGFFEHLIRHQVIAAADDARGRFRSFLLQCFKHFTASERTRAGAQKRGGGQPVLPLDAGRGEAQFQEEAADRRDPEVLYERNWAFALLNEGWERLALECERSGRSHVFQLLSPLLRGDTDGVSYGRAAELLDTTVATVHVMAHRLRRRYRDVLRELAAQTVGSPAEVDEELRHLRRLFQT